MTAPNDPSDNASDQKGNATSPSGKTRPVIHIEDPFERPEAPIKRFALFNYGFRPFFLAAGVFAVVSVVAWLWLFAAGGDLGLVVLPVRWHAHEMLFGYSAAAMAGFFLTVVPNWTRVSAQKGPVLMVLTGLWLAGRLVYWAQGWLDPIWVAGVDMLFLLALLGVVVRPLIARQHRRQLVFVPILMALAAGNAMMHLGAFGASWGVSDLGIDWAVRGQMLGLNALVVLIAVMGGRVTPSFTSSWLGHGNPALTVAQRPGLDRFVLTATWGVLVADLLWPHSIAAGAVSILAAGLHLARLAGWQGLKTLKNPILWVLHLGYLWLVVGLALKGMGDFGVLGLADGLHALTIGAVGTMTIAIMTRASLGHTGRSVRAHPLIVAAYVLLGLSALARLAVVVWPERYVEAVVLSGGLWSVAFLLFVVIYAPILLGPRVDGRPG